MSVTVEVASEVTSELVEVVARLLPQLSSSAVAPGADELREVVGRSGSWLFLARAGRVPGEWEPGESEPDESESGESESAGGMAADETRVIGMLSLVAYRIPTGLHAVIEDVVVDEGARGTGAGEALVKAALDLAREAGVRHVDLTSRASREAANRLYLKVGFFIRETNIYRYSFA